MLPSPASPARRLPASVLASLLVNAVLPLVLYALLSPHMSQLHAVLLVALVPLAEGLITFARHRRIDALGVFILATLLLGAAIVVLGGTPRLILAREQILTGAIGLLLLGSLLLPRPAAFYLFRAVVTRQDSGGRAPFDARWETSPSFRRLLRRVTVVFGLGIVAEAAINITLALLLSIPAFLAVSPVVRYGIAGLLLAWFVLAVRQVRRASSEQPTLP
jgi:hypothetical protein